MEPRRRSDPASFRTLSTGAGAAPGGRAEARSAGRLWPRPLGSRLGRALVLCGLLPALSVAWQAASLELGVAGEPLPAPKRQVILGRIPSDPSVLINVTAEDMPASPDILNLGKRSTKALERCLADNADPNIRSTCAGVLQSLGDRRALATLHAALDDWEPTVRLRVVQALGAMPDASSVAPLLRLYQRKDEEHQNRVAILEALGAMSDQRVVRLLRQELGRKPQKGDDEGGEDMRPQAFDALWASRHLMARGTLESDVIAALRSDNSSLVLAATEAAAELRSPGLVGALVPLMEHQQPDVRNKAVYALGRVGDKTATKALLERLPQVRDGRMLNNLAFALERLDKAAFYDSIKQVIEHKQAVIRLNAAFVLGDVRHPEGLGLLEKALRDPSDYVRTSAIVAVGKLGITKAGVEGAVKALGPFVDDPNLSVREAAIYALHALSEGGRSDLIYERLFLQLSPEKNAESMRRAAVVLGKAGDERIRDYLVSCLEGYRCSTDEVGPFLRAKPGPRSSGRVLLAWARGRQDLAGLVSQLKPQGALPLASSTLDSAWARREIGESERAIDVVGSLGDSSAQSLLAPHSSAERTWLRLHALVALVRLGDAGASSRLLAEIDNLPAAWLPQFARLVATIAEPAARAKLDGELEKRQSDKVWASRSLLRRSASPGTRTRPCSAFSTRSPRRSAPSASSRPATSTATRTRR
jgi:HEAT repeat protein